MEDLASRFAHRVQLTTDGLKAYLYAVDDAFGIDIDYARLAKMYGESTEAKMQKRYSPAKFIASRKEAMTGNPERKHISTSDAERQNLTMRMSMRRFTHLTKCFLKKGGEPISCGIFTFHILQFRKNPQNPQSDPGDESGGHRSCLDFRRNRGPEGFKLIHYRNLGKIDFPPQFVLFCYL